MHRRWLSWPLLSSCASAFYPYHETGQNDPRSVSTESARSVSDRPVDLDLHKFENRNNVFSILYSNNSTAPNGLAINQDGSDLSYFSTVTFGSKGQPMNMLIDTGSANTWVFSSNCRSQTCSMHNLFGPEDSTTLNTSASAWNLSYGTGSVSGVVGTDTVTFANFSLTMGFGLAVNASNDFDNYPMDGILGLGRPASDSLGVPTVMQVLASQGNIARNVIGVKLNRATDPIKDGEIIFGGVDTNKFSGQIAYTQASSNSSWEIPIMDAVMGGVPCNFTSKGAIIDTGTTYILMPPADATTLHSLIPGSALAAGSTEQYTVPCNTNISMQIKISNILYTILPKDYVGKPSGNVCNSNIIGHQAFGVNDWILGDVFLKNVYSVFDYDQDAIGFGTLGSGGTDPTAQATSSSSTNSSSTGSGSSSSSSSHHKNSAPTLSASWLNEVFLLALFVSVVLVI